MGWHRITLNVSRHDEEAASDQDDVRNVVLPRFGGHLKIGTTMCLEVFYVEEKII